MVNATETTEDGTPLFYKDELVMLSIAPDEGYMLSTLSVNGTAAAVAVGEDAYTFAQPEENVTITATFEKRNEHTVTFDANGGSEPKDLPEEVTTAMPAKKVLHGSEYCLPECEFIAPEGKQFKAWQIGGFGICCERSRDRHRGHHSQRRCGRTRLPPLSSTPSPSPQRATERLPSLLTRLLPVRRSP
ncbi:MAG: InlB B-repeat-containing protein [Oscillospiraceae bacterium]